MTDAFFLPLGGHRFQATAHTVGPWSPDAQHGGPPSALLARAIERCDPREDLMVARITTEILGAIPAAEVEVTARVARPGRSVELVEATMRAAGREVMLARAWRLRRTTGASVASRDAAAPDRPEQATVIPRQWSGGYLGALEWRYARGALVTPGPATVWARSRVGLVSGEPMSPLQRIIVLADGGNGASSELDLTAWWFINTDLSVHIHREPIGEWLCLDATTTIADGGCGLATSVISDDRGPVARGAQALYVAPRPAASQV